MKEENKNISDLASSFEALSKVVQSNSVALAPQFANIAEVTKIIEEKTAPLKAVAEAMQGWQSSFALTLATITEGIPDLSNMRNVIQFPDLSKFAPIWARLTEIQPTLSTQIKIISAEVPLMQSNISSFLNVIDFKFDVFSDFVKDINGLSANVAEGYIKKDAELKIQYNNIMEEYKPYFTRKDILTPNNYYEFKDWLFFCLYPDAYFYTINIVPNDFILFDEYRVNQIENYNWTEYQERERLNSERQKRLGQDNALQIGSNDTLSHRHTALEWMFILYHIREYKYPKISVDTELIRQFIDDNNITGSFSNYKNKYSEIKNINLDEARDRHTRALSNVLCEIKKTTLEGYNKAKSDLEYYQDELDLEKY